jgi:predicted Zn-dependent protease
VLSKAYSQDQEYEADRLGLCLAHLAGFQQRSGPEFMDVMTQVAKDGSAPTGGAKRIAYDLLSSHPPSPDRKRYLESLAKLIAKQSNTNKK